MGIGRLVSFLSFFYYLEDGDVIRDENWIEANHILLLVARQRTTEALMITALMK